MRFWPLTILCVLVVFMGAAYGLDKHPRVIEIEALFQKEAIDVLQARFPGQPVLVTVEVEPLRRFAFRQPDSVGERLPYFDLDEEEIQDEWDNPALSLSHLRNRIRRTVLDISMPDTVSDKDAAEAKETVMAALNLVPGRDQIEIHKKPWLKKPLPRTVWPLAAAVGFLLFMLGLYFIFRSSTRRLAHSIKSTSSSSSHAQAAPIMPTPSTKDASSSSSNGMGFQFNDALKIREAVRVRIDELENSLEFPTLQDMIDLQELGKKDHRELGALVSEFTLVKQRMLFAFSSDPLWLDAFHEPGELRSRSLTVIEKLVRNQNNSSGQNWEHALIQVWRLGSQIERFAKLLDQQDAIAVLHALPKSIGVPAARAAFPGGWGVLLDPTYKPRELTYEMMARISEAALKILPERDIKILEKFRRDKELLDYLKKATVDEEREIYQASPKDSVIHGIRPPFYRLFEQEDEFYEEFVYKYPLEQWALALFNVPRALRKVIEDRFSEKEEQLFVQRMRDYDRQPPNLEHQGELREQMARLLDEIINRHELEKLDKEQEEEIAHILHDDRKDGDAA
jgi:hypothetical protein